LKPQKSSIFKVHTTYPPDCASWHTTPVFFTTASSARSTIDFENSSNLLEKVYP